jgi:hypothetical protein
MIHTSLIIIADIDDIIRKTFLRQLTGYWKMNCFDAGYGNFIDFEVFGTVYPPADYHESVVCVLLL